MKLIKLASILVLLLAVEMVLGSNATSVGTAATEPTGKIAGVVLDANDARIVNATVTTENRGTKHTMKSGNEGEFEVSVPAGDYKITVEANGFRKFSNSPLTVKADETKLISVHLKVAVYSSLVPASPQ